MKSKLEKSEDWVVKLWSNDLQLALAISSFDFSGQENHCVRCPEDGVIFFRHRDELWRLGLELSQTFDKRLWEDIQVSLGVPNDEVENPIAYSLMDFYHHFVSPLLSESILSQELECFSRPIAESENHNSIVANEYFLRHESDGKSVCIRDLFEFADQFGFHNDLHWMAIEKCLPQCYTPHGDRKAFIKVDSAHNYENSYAWSEILDATADNANDAGAIVFEVSLIGEGDEKLLAGFSSEIRARGFEVALDDWGQKNNSLRTLDLVRPDYVKVSEKLIHGAHSDPYRQKLLSGMVKLATELGIKTVAEGIATADDWSCAIDAGFLWLQGDYVGKPSAIPHLDASIGCAPFEFGASIGNEPLFGKCQ